MREKNETELTQFGILLEQSGEVLIFKMIIHIVLSAVRILLLFDTDEEKGIDYLITNEIVQPASSTIQGDEAATQV